MYRSHADALTLVAGGDALLPLRQMMLLPGESGNLMGLMPSYLGGIVHPCDIHVSRST
jgi:hypothetical protein